MREKTCHRYPKSTDSGIILIFCICEPLQRKNVSQGTVHSIFNEATHCEYWDVALMEHQETRTENQYPIECSSCFVNETLNKKVSPQQLQQKHQKMNNISKQ